MIFESCILRKQVCEFHVRDRGDVLDIEENNFSQKKKKKIPEKYKTSK